MASSRVSRCPPARTSRRRSSRRCSHTCRARRRPISRCFPTPCRAWTSCSTKQRQLSCQSATRSSQPSSPPLAAGPRRAAPTPPRWRTSARTAVRRRHRWCTSCRSWLPWARSASPSARSLRLRTRFMPLLATSLGLRKRSPAGWRAWKRSKCGASTPATGPLPARCSRRALARLSLIRPRRRQCGAPWTSTSSSPAWRSCRRRRAVPRCRLSQCPRRSEGISSC
mmetsp:Transcript_41795/g.106965  ORF Transcript_41795/g.106965 Transcript_41795/m.106965 type:complete len:225 (+) Transcript_41795:518-1192(+)